MTHGPRRSRRRTVLVVVAILLAGVIAIGAWLVLHDRDGSTAVSRSGAADLVGASDAQADIDPGARPPAGTYEYSGSGDEHLSLLGGSSHTFPDTMYAVVELDADDECAWTMHLVMVAEHVEDRTWCTDDAGVHEIGLTRTTIFLGREQTSTYECSEGALRLPADAQVGRPWTWTCTEARGGVVEYSARLIGEEQLSVEGAAVDTRHIVVTGRQRIKSTGDETSHWWIADTGLPVQFRSRRKISTDAGPLGTMHSREQYEWTLVSLTPDAT